MLFATANLLACLCANLLQGRFNKATQDKLTEALRKARRSHAFLCFHVTMHLVSFECSGSGATRL